MGNAVYTRDEFELHEFKADVSNTVEWILAMSYLFTAVFVLCITLIHIREMYQHDDLCPKKQANQINPYYATVQWYTLFSLIFFCVFEVGLFLSFSREEFCFNDIVIGMNGYYLAETLFYAVGILRLKLMYLGTKYESPTTLVVITVSMCHCAYFIATNIVWFDMHSITWIESTDPSFPRFCIGQLKSVSVFFVCMEFLFVIGLLGRAWYKLNGILKIKGSGLKLEELKSYAIRVTVLYGSAASICIIGWIVLSIASIGAKVKLLQVFITHLSIIVTVSALCLMTSYYPKAYGRLCYICIACCDPSFKSTRNDGTIGDDQRKYLNIHTMISVSQFRDHIKTLDVSGAVIQNASPNQEDTQDMEQGTQDIKQEEEELNDKTD